MKKIFSILLTLCMLVTLIGIAPGNKALAINSGIDQQMSTNVNDTFVNDILSEAEVSKYIDYQMALDAKHVERLYEGHSNAPNNNTYQWQYDGDNSQKWVFELQQDGYYTIKSVYSGLYLSVQGNSSANSASVVQLGGGTAAGQRWKITRTSSGAYKISAKCGEALGMALSVDHYILNTDGIYIKHMTYTDDSGYKDEWYMMSGNYNVICVDVVYDNAYTNRFYDGVSKINSYMQILQTKYMEEIGIYVSYTPARQFSSYSDLNCDVNHTSICGHATNNECTNNGEYHHTNIYSILYKLPRPDTSKMIRMAYIGQQNCFKNNDKHVINPYFGLTIQQYGVATITNYAYTQSELKTVVYEFGHFYGAPDHYGESTPTTKEINIKNPGYNFNENCIYGEKKDTNDVIDDLTICDGCKMFIKQNISRYNH